jgi:hypothetical protein
MEAGEMTVIELLTVQEGRVDEAKEMMARSVALFSQIPGVHRAWAIQDQRRPGEFAFVSLLDAARASEIERESDEAEWHKAMLPRWGEILIRERFRRIIGPTVA